VAGHAQPSVSAVTELFLVCPSACPPVHAMPGPFAAIELGLREPWRLAPAASIRRRGAGIVPL